MKMDCIRCGGCCRILYWTDRIKMSWELKTLIWRRVCKFLMSNNECSIYDKRPKICRDWVYCGVYHLGEKDE